MMMTLHVVLLTAVVALVQTPATADPLQDDLDAIAKEFCDGELSKECLTKFRAEMAYYQGFQEAALKVCPRMVVTDPQLRDLRNKKYSASPEFVGGYRHVIAGYDEGDFSGRETLCYAAISDQPLHPKTYRKDWLKIEWKPEDRVPLIPKEALVRKAQAFQNGYHNARCNDLCEVREGELADPVYAAGWNAGRIDFQRTLR